MAKNDIIGKHKTRIYTEDGLTHVKYHDTNVVSFNGDIIHLRTGGYFSNTTKTRMNQASCQFGLGFSVYQKDFVWYVDFNNKTLKFTGNDITLNRKG